MTIVTVIVWFLASVTFAGPEQSSESLRAAARAHGGRATMLLTQDFSALTVDELIDKSNVIVRGRVQLVRPHLSTDESYVVTDVTIAPTRVFKQTVAVTVSSRPGSVSPLVVRHTGGTVVDDGLTMSTFTTAFAAHEQFSVGEEVICFLTFSEQHQMFFLTDGPFAAFRIIGSDVHRFTKEAQLIHLNGAPVPLAAFLAEIDRRVQK